MDRTFNYDILPLIKTRWSSRAISSEKIPREEILALVEAARYAPSCFNEQPWYFLIADTDDAHANMVSVLTDGNKAWAATAPVLIAVCAKKVFTHNGSPNFWNQFDTGTAWGYFSLEAERRGLVAHGMAGLDRSAAAKIFELPSEYEVIAAIAVGKPGKKENLPEKIREMEKPNTRKDLSEVYSFGKFGVR
jgi:nitroreductase